MAKYKSSYSEFLEKLQQESWNLELIISLTALFAVYNSEWLLLKYDTIWSIALVGIPKFAAGIFITILFIARKVFLINLVIHIIMRGFWIGTIGLRQVSGDIQFDNLGYSSKFTDYLKKSIGDFDEFIERLEKFCSLIFAFTFLVVFYVISLFSLILFPVLITTITLTISESDFVESIIIFFLIFYLFGCVLVLIDFITNGCFKKLSHLKLSKIYYFIYRFYNTISFSFIYKSLYYNFVDDKYAKKFISFLIPYLCIISLQLFFSNTKYPHFKDIKNTEVAILDDRFYLDKRQDAGGINEIKYNTDYRKSNLPPFVMEKYKVDSGLTSIFFRLDANDKYLLEFKHGIPAKWKSGINFSFRDEIKDKSIFKKLDDNRKKYEDSISKILLNYKINTNDSISFYNVLNYSGVALNFMNFKKGDKYLRDSLNQLLKFTNLIDSLKTNISFKINSIQFRDSLKCFYYQHFNLSEPGIQCYYNSNILHKDLNEIEVARIYAKVSNLKFGNVKKEDVKYDTFKLSLPIIKL